MSWRDGGGVWPRSCPVFYKSWRQLIFCNDNTIILWKWIKSVQVILVYILKRQNIFGVIKVSISSILRYQHGILLQLLPLKLVLFFFIHFLYQFFAFFYSTLYTYRSSNYWYRGDGDNLYFSFPLSLKKWQQLLCQFFK